MDVYVESNFVLERALLQEQHASCEELIRLGEAGQIRLILPAYSLVEPYETLTRATKTRTRLLNDLTTEAGQLSRSQPYQQEMETVQQVTVFLLRSLEEDKQRLQLTLERLVRTAEVLPLTGEILSAALALQVSHHLSPQDAVVYASVLDHLSSSKAALKSFLNRNSKDFDDPDIVATLEQHGCRMLFRFDHGCDYIKSVLARGGTPTG